MLSQLSNITTEKEALIVNRRNGMRIRRMVGAALFGIGLVWAMGIDTAAAAEAVPRKSAPVTKAPQLEGAVIEGNRIRALPGYVLEPGPNNQLMVRKRAGGSSGPGAIPGCGCVGGTGGTCTVSTDGKDSGSCYKRSGDTCTGECKFTVSTPGGGTLQRPQ